MEISCPIQLHMAQKISKAYSVLGIIRRNFIHMDESSFILLYKSMVRSHLREYANSVWCPYKQGDIRELEKIQTRMWANAQPDGRPAEHRWRPLFNAAKFG